VSAQPAYRLAVAARTGRGDRAATATADPLPPFVFVHGACGSKRGYEACFLEWFAARGGDAYAFDLRGHGASEGKEDLQRFGIGDYVDDLRHVVERLPAPPIVAGHSMGGLVVQKYLEAGHPAVGGVLLASSPVNGMQRDGMRLALRYPRWFAQVLESGRARDLFSSEEQVRALLLPPDAPEQMVADCLAFMEDESWRAWEQTYTWLPQPQKVTVPMLVLGGALDQIVSPSSVRRTAEAYRAPHVLFDSMAHLLPVEPGWEEVARAILEWAPCTNFPNPSWS
jgi:hypothetical protein